MRAGFEPTNSAMRTDLQSAAFNHSATSKKKIPTEGFEPPLMQSKCIALPLGYV